MTALCLMSSGKLPRPARDHEVYVQFWWGHARAAPSAGENLGRRNELRAAFGIAAAAEALESLHKQPLNAGAWCHSAIAPTADSGHRDYLQPWPNARWKAF